MVQKINFTGEAPQLPAPIAPKANEKKNIIQSVKDGDKKSIAILVGAGTIAAATVTGTIAFLKNRPEAIVKNLDAAAQKTKEEAVKLINETLNSFSTKAVEAAEGVEAKPAQNVFEIVQNTLNKYQTVIPEDGSIKIPVQKISDTKAIQIQASNTHPFVNAKLLEGDKTIGILSGELIDGKLENYIFKMDNFGKKQNDRIAVDFVENFNGTLNPKTQEKEAELFSDFIDKIDIVKKFGDNGFKSEFIYSHDYSNSLEPEQAIMKYSKNNKSHKLKANLYYENGSPKYLIKNYKETQQGSKSKLYEFDENGKWKKTSLEKLQAEYDDESLFDDDFDESSEL